MQILITVLVVLFVTLAVAQVVVFDLTPKTKTNVVLHMAVAYLGMGAAFYALFLSWLNFGDGGRIGLILTVIGIVFVGSLLKKKWIDFDFKIRRKKSRQAKGGSGEHNKDQLDADDSSPVDDSSE